MSIIAHAFGRLLLSVQALYKQVLVIRSEFLRLKSYNLLVVRNVQPAAITGLQTHF